MPTYPHGYPHRRWISAVRRHDITPGSEILRGFQARMSCHLYGCGNVDKLSTSPPPGSRSRMSRSSHNPGWPSSAPPCARPRMHGPRRPGAHACARTRRLHAFTRMRTRSSEKLLSPSRSLTSSSRGGGNGGKPVSIAMGRGVWPWDNLLIKWPVLHWPNRGGDRPPSYPPSAPRFSATYPPSYPQVPLS